MFLVLEVFASHSHRQKWLQAKRGLRKRVSLLAARLQSVRISDSAVLLYAILVFYLVGSRLGPVVTRVGETAVETFELNSLLEAEINLQPFKDIYRRFRDVTRVPGPFGRRSSDTPLLRIVSVMGNRSSKKNVAIEQPQPPAAQQPGVSQDVAVKKEIVEQKGEPPVAEEINKQDKASKESTPASVDSSDKPANSFAKRRFSEIEHKISTGDLALLFRDGQETPHYAIFVDHGECDPNFPLLLIKGKTKPLPLEKFNPDVPRNVHPISAVTRIFYGDYKDVAVRHLVREGPVNCTMAMSLIDEIQKIPFSPSEIEAIKNAKTPEERSSIVCTFMVAYFYKHLNFFDGDPTSVTPESFQEQIKLSSPTYIDLPPVKPGPVATGDPPFLATLVSGIYPPPNVSTKPYSVVAETLKTGDLVLFSGATSSGAIIKFFDHSQFSHCGIVLRAKYTSQLLVWEASTNRAGLVDVESGQVSRGVELLPLRHKIFSGWYNRVAVRRLVDITDEHREQLYEKMLEIRKEFQGRPYEKDNIELILSAIDIQEGFLSFLRNTQEDLSSLFCSEAVAAAYQRLGLLGTEKLSNEYTPDDFSSERGLQLKFGRLAPETYIELKFDFDSHPYGTQRSVY